jgi:tetratricopeptide (TPR) repeat protein
MKIICLSITLFFLSISIYPQNREEVRPVERERRIERTRNSDQGTGDTVSDERIRRLETNPTQKETELPPNELEPEPRIVYRPYLHGDCLPLPAHKKVLIYTSKKEEGIKCLLDEDFYKAIELFNEALKENNKDLELFYSRGIAGLEYGLYEGAIDDFSYYLEFFNDDEEAYFRRGLAYFFFGERKLAGEDFQTAAASGHKKAGEILRRYY